MDNFEFKFNHKNNKNTDEDITFKTGHIEPICLDVLVVCSNTNQVGRPWVTMMIDEYSKKILALDCSLELPSYKSVKRTIEECLRKHSRLPNMIIVESGDLVDSKELHNLVNQYNFNLEIRPKSNLSKTSIEKLFKNIDNKFSNNNSPKALKNCR